MKIVFIRDNYSYEVVFKDLVIDLKGGDFSAEDIKVFCDGNLLSDFGKSFTGEVRTAEDFLKGAYLAFVNQDDTCDFIEVPGVFSSDNAEYLTCSAKRNIPKQFLNWELSLLDCLIVSKKGEAGYSDGDSFVLTDANGSVETDKEAFFMNGALDIYHEGYVYIEPSFKESLDSMS